MAINGKRMATHNIFTVVLQVFLLVTLLYYSHYMKSFKRFSLQYSNLTRAQEEQRVLGQIYSPLCMNSEVLDVLDCSKFQMFW